MPFSSGCFSITGHIKDLIQDNLLLIQEWMSNYPSAAWQMRARVTWQSSSSYIWGMVAIMSAPATDMDATKADNPLQWETSVGDNLCENEMVLSPIYSARTVQTGYAIKMLVWFPFVSFLCFCWSREKNNPISLSQNLLSDFLFQMPIMKWLDRRFSLGSLSIFITLLSLL